MVGLPASARFAAPRHWWATVASQLFLVSWLVRGCGDRCLGEGPLRGWVPWSGREGATCAPLAGPGRTPPREKESEEEPQREKVKGDRSACIGQRRYQPSKTASKRRRRKRERSTMDTSLSLSQIFPLTNFFFYEFRPEDFWLSCITYKHQKEKKDNHGEGGKEVQSPTIVGDSTDDGRGKKGHKWQALKIFRLFNPFFLFRGRYGGENNIFFFFKKRRKQQKGRKSSTPHY